MNVLEIIAAILLIISCVVIFVLVLSQQPKKGGLSGIITGADMTVESRVRTKDSRLAVVTRYAGIVFFVLTFAVNLVNVIVQNKAS